MQTSHTNRGKVPVDQDGIRKRIKRIIGEKAEGKQGILASMTNIQPGTLSKQLSGSELVNINNLKKIEQATGVRLAWLENGIEPVYHPGGKAPQPMSEIGEGAMLKAYLKKIGVPSTKLADMIGRKKSTVSGYFSRKELEAETHRVILDALGASEEDIFGGIISHKSLNNVARYTPYIPSSEDSVQITRIPVRARAGFDYNSYFSDHSGERETKGVRRDLIKPNFDLEKNFNSIALVEIDGDSMEPLLRPGYEVIGYLIDPSDWPYQTQVVAVAFRDQFVVKRILENGLLMTGMLTLTSDNPSGGTIIVPVSEIHRVWKIDRITNGKI